MSIRVPNLRALAERLRDPLWLPVLSALFAFLAFEAASLDSGQTVLVAARNLPAGTPLTAADVRRAHWTGKLPGPLLNRPEGRLAVPLAAGLPLLRSVVRLGPAGSGNGAQVVGIPAGALLSAPPLSAGQLVSVYMAEAGQAPESLVPQAQVAAGGTAGSVALEVSAARLPALLAGVAAGHLIITAMPQE